MGVRPPNTGSCVPVAGETRVCVYGGRICVSVKSLANIRLTLPPSRIRGLGTKYWSNCESGTETRETRDSASGWWGGPEGPELKALWDLGLGYW